MTKSKVAPRANAAKFVDVPCGSEHATWGYNDRQFVSCSVDPDGAVSVWDPIADHFTRVHSLPAELIAEARRLAGFEVQP